MALRKMNLPTSRLRDRAHTVLVQCHGILLIRAFVPNIPMVVWALEEEERRLASTDAGGVDIPPEVDAEDLTWDLLAVLPPAPGVDTWDQYQAVEDAVEWGHLEDPQSAMDPAQAAPTAVWTHTADLCRPPWMTLITMGGRVRCVSHHPGPLAWPCHRIR